MGEVVDGKGYLMFGVINIWLLSGSELVMERGMGEDGQSNSTIHKK